MRNILKKILGISTDEKLGHTDLPPKAPWARSDRSPSEIIKDHAAVLTGPDPLPQERGPSLTERDRFNELLKSAENQDMSNHFRWATRHAPENRQPGAFGPTWNPRLVGDVEAVMDAAYNPDNDPPAPADVRPGDEFFILVPDEIPRSDLVGVAPYARGNLDPSVQVRNTSQGARARVLEVNGEEAVCLYLDRILSGGDLMPHGTVYRCSLSHLALNPRVAKGPELDLSSDVPSA